jgi:hypothetical protein
MIDDAASMHLLSSPILEPSNVASFLHHDSTRSGVVRGIGYLDIAEAESVREGEDPVRIHFNRKRSDASDL